MELYRCCGERGECSCAYRTKAPAHREKRVGCTESVLYECFLLAADAECELHQNTTKLPMNFLSDSRTTSAASVTRSTVHSASQRASFGVVADAMTGRLIASLASVFSTRPLPSLLLPAFQPTGDFGVRWAGVTSAPSRSVLREVALGNSRTCQQVPNPGVTHTHNTRHRQPTPITHLQSHSLRRHPTPQGDCHHHWHRRQRHGLHC